MLLPERSRQTYFFLFAKRTDPTLPVVLAPSPRSLTFSLTMQDVASVFSVCASNHVAKSAMLVNVLGLIVLSSPPTLVTVTAHCAVLLPSAVVTVIVAVPAATAVTMPSETVAFVASLDDHVTALFVALSGATVAVRVSVSPTFREILFLLSVTPVTGMVVMPPSSSPQAIENPITATSAIIPISFKMFFIKNSVNIHK